MPQFKPNPGWGRNRTAAEMTVHALRELGRLDTVDEARVVTLVALADAVDADPANASLWREYRAAESALRELSAGDVDEFAALLDSLSAEVGDSAPRGKKNARG